MPNKQSFWEKITGKRTKDIELLNESGMVDPKLDKNHPSVKEAIAKSDKDFKKSQKDALMNELLKRQ